MVSIEGDCIKTFVVIIIGVLLLLNPITGSDINNGDREEMKKNGYLEHYEECKTVNEVLKNIDFDVAWCEKDKFTFRNSDIVIDSPVKKFHKICKAVYKDKYGNLFFRLGGSFDDEWGIVIVNNPDNINFDGYPTSVKLLDDCYYFSSYSDDW